MEEAKTALYNAVQPHVAEYFRKEYEPKIKVWNLLPIIL